MKNKTGLKPIRLLIPLAVLVLFSLACAISVPRTIQLPTGSSPTHVPLPTYISPTLAPINIPAAITDEQSLLVNLYARVNPSVVNIAIYATSGGSMERVAQGSGFVYDVDRHIVTNDHVIEGAEQIEVTFSDGTIVPAKLIGQDLYSDLAVLQVDKIPEGVQPLPMADMNSLAVGQTVIALGNPFGLEGSLTRGIISALGREIPSLVTSFKIPLAIQTDAAINPGNSGGPLLNLQGQVIGVNAQIETGGTSRSNTGVGFAIPVSILQRTLPDLVSKGKTEWAYLGVYMRDVNPDIKQAIGLPVDRGAYISNVPSDTPAGRAGLRGSNDTQTVNQRVVEVGGDVVTAADGQAINSADDLIIYLAFNKQPGDDVTLSIIRDGKADTIILQLAARPADVTPSTSP